MMILPKIIIILRTLFITEFNEFTRNNDDLIKDNDEFADIINNDYTKNNDDFVDIMNDDFIQDNNDFEDMNVEESKHSASLVPFTSNFIQGNSKHI